VFVTQQAEEQPLLRPYELGDLQLRNRIVMAPMTRARAQTRRPRYTPSTTGSARAPG